MVARHPFLHFVGPGADRGGTVVEGLDILSLRELLLDDVDEADLLDKFGRWALGLELDGQRVDCLHAGNRAHIAAEGCGAVRDVLRPLERIDDILGRQGAPILKQHTRAQLDAPSGGIDVGPGFRKCWCDLEVRIRFDQAIEDLCGDVLIVTGARELRIERRRLRGTAKDDIGCERRRYGEDRRRCDKAKTCEAGRWFHGVLLLGSERGDCWLGMSRLIVVEMAGADMA